MSGIIAIRFDEKSFFSTIQGFNPPLDYKHYIKCVSQKIKNLNAINKIYFKCDFVDGSIVNGLRQLMLLSFV